MLHNDATVAPDRNGCSGIRTLDDHAFVAPDRRNVPVRSIRSRAFVYGQTPRRYRCQQDQEKKTQ
jgi:hypothetical protein